MVSEFLIYGIFYEWSLSCLQEKEDLGLPILPFCQQYSIINVLSQTEMVEKV